MKDKKNKRLDEFKKKVDDLISKREQQISEPTLFSVSETKSNIDPTNINDFSKIYGEETYKKIMENFKNIKK